MSYYFAFSTPSLISLIQSQLPIEASAKLYSPQKAHATMLYVYGEYEKELESVFAANMEATIENIEVWSSDSKGGVSYLVATLDNPQLHVLNQRLQAEINYVDPRQSFKPHISLQKSKNKDELVDPQVLQFLIGQKVLLENFHCRDIGSKNEPSKAEPNNLLPLNTHTHIAPDLSKLELVPLTPEEEIYFKRKLAKTRK